MYFLTPIGPLIWSIRLSLALRRSFRHGRSLFPTRRADLTCVMMLAEGFMAS
jgi:hypothetical protein